MKALKDKGIITQVHYIPVVNHPYYKNKGYNSENLPNTNNYYSEALSLPLYYSLDESDQDYVIDCLKNIIT